MLQLILLSFCFILIYSYDRGPHMSETVVERFRFGEYDFVFYSKEANWAEALTICKATHSRLAMVNTPARAKFLADALTQTKVGFEDVWIGGRFQKDRWRWVATGKPFSKRFPDFPPWLSYPTQRGRNCLALDRINHSYPIFVEKKCSSSTGFVCEESTSHALDNFPEEGGEININDRQYFLYHGRVTWEEALTFCKQTESRLATIPDLDTATKLVGMMKRTRPPFENMWIGGRRTYLDWIWVATERVLRNETGQDGFPPWKNDHPANKKGCLLLDHHPCSVPFHYHTSRKHRCEEPVFIEEECELKKDFMCEVAVEETVIQERSNLITVDQITYIFYEEHLNWVDAMVACERINMTLAMPETSRQWETIVTHMGDLQREFYHIWLGGRWFPNEWAWLNNRSIPLPSGNATYPPWCSSSELHETDEDCLNLDRDSHNIAIIHGYNCSVKQGFVCQLEAFDAIETPDSSFNNNFEHVSSSLTFFEADYACILNRSHLAIVNSMQIAQKLALLIPRDTLIWIDGKRVNNIWRWSKTQEIIPDVAGEDNYPPWESSASTVGQSMCLAMKSGYREQPFFVEKPCKEKLNHLCQTEHDGLPEPDITLNLNGINYYFYKKGVPWHKAMSTCQSGGLFLVNVGNLALANALLDGMGDGNSQWTSGREQFLGHWSWITSGMKLPTEIKRGYPPWINGTIPNNTASSVCLLLDKISDSPAFVGEDCLKNHSFVCIDKIFIYNETEINMGNITINIQDVITSISKAKKKCLDAGKSVVDFSKLNYKELLKILKAENVKSLWVDVIYNSDGKWVYADTLQEFQTDIDFPGKDSHSKTNPKNCLTLQLTSEEQLILVPSLCSDFSRIVCMAAIKKNATVPQRVEYVVNNTVTIIAILENTAISDSNLVCNDIDGDVIRSQLLDKGIQFFQKLHPDYKYFWLGASLVNNKWLWNDNTTVTLKDLPLTHLSTPNALLCLIYSREADKLKAVNCTDKFSTVCQRVIYKCNAINASSKSVGILWSPNKCTAELVKAGTVCRAQCQNNANLVGPELHICMKGRWSYKADLLCRNDKSQGLILSKLLGTRMKNEKAESNFLFVIDNGLVDKKGLERSNYEKSLQFARHLSNTILLSQKRRVGIELYSYNAKIIDFMESKNCYLKHTIEKLYKSKITVSRNLPNYYIALKTAEQEFTGRSIVSNSAYIFFFAMRPDAGPMQNRTEIVKRLKSLGVTIVIITVGDEINRSQLEEMASVRFDGLQLYSFSNLKGMQDAANVLKSKSRVRDPSCPRENLEDTVI